MNKASYIAQRTLAKPVTLSGIGLHRGQAVELQLLPCPPDHGIVFRIQQDGATVNIPARAEFIQDTIMCSNLVAHGVRVSTIEHLMSACAGLGIDNLLVVLNCYEVPILDGSATPFVQAMRQVGIVEQDLAKQFIVIKHAVRVVQDDKWAMFEPFEGFRLDFKIDFNHPAICATKQHFTFDLSSENFVSEIGSARTFGFIHDLEHLKSQQLALGANLSNAIGLDSQRVLNPEGLRFDDEFVRHKILDAIGDLYLLGHQIVGKFSAYKSGHGLNNQLLRLLHTQPNCYELMPLMPHQTSISYA